MNQFLGDIKSSDCKEVPMILMNILAAVIEHFFYLFSFSNYIVSLLAHFVKLNEP